MVTKEFWENYIDEGKTKITSLSSSLFVDSLKSAASSHGLTELAQDPRLLASSLSHQVQERWLALKSWNVRSEKIT